MAIIYLRSTDGNDVDDGSTWALAKATLAAALTAAGASGTVYVSHVHAETQASSMALTSPGTAASPTLVLCVNDGAAPPTALATTATVTTTGNSSLSFSGVTYCYGVTFNCGTGNSGISLNFTSTTAWWWRFEACALKLVTTSTSSRIAVGGLGTASADEKLELYNTTVSFANVSQGITVRTPLVWQNTASAITGATLPTTLFLTPGSAIVGYARLSGVDLSALGSGKNLISVGSGTFADYYFEDCKLGSSVSVTTGSVAGQGGTTVRLVNCDSADTNYRYYRQTYQGTITQETTIVRTGGASDGTTPVSRKMVSTANGKFFSPLESDPILFWNEITSPIAVTVEVITDGVTLTDVDAWIEVEYMGTSGFPQGNYVSDRAVDVLATGTNQTTSTAVWTTTGLSSPTTQKLNIAFTPQKKGLIRCRVMLAKPSTTMYFCPKAEVG